jgi:GGDEF domain-containing protein
MAAELAAEAFADTSFVPNISRRIAEWRRGGDTLTVVLARVEGAKSATDMDSLPIRLALKVARGSAREMDLITRWQGDGLAILLPCTTATDAKAFVRRLRKSFAKRR